VPILVDRGQDQADGLRRLFGGVRTRVLELAAGIPGVGRTCVAVNLAVALARSGRQVLLADFVADPQASRASRALGIPGEIGDVPVPACKGLALMTLSHRTWIERGPQPAAALHAGQGLRDGAAFDWVLVSGGSLEPVVASDDGGRDVLIVLSNDARSITEGYALVKRIAGYDRRCRFRVLVNRVQSEAAAQRIVNNMAQAARGYLDVDLAMIGFVPADSSVERAAAAGISVFEQDPASRAAQAFARLADVVASRSAVQALRGDQRSHLAVAAGVM